jgi:hypothetical protein
LKLKAKLRHSRRSPGGVDRQSIEADREELTALVIELKRLQQGAGVAETNASIAQSSANEDAWDDLAFDPIESGAGIIPSSAEYSKVRAEVPKSNKMSSYLGPSSTETLTPVPIENQLLCIPSNGNASSVHRQLELYHRISQADSQLNNIRNLIAEKSFQFSHVIRVSPRKGVTTRARATVKKINNQIAEHCRMYARCRECILILDADPTVLSRYQVLLPADIAGSTAVLNPNEPGSTSIKLSWIWQSSAFYSEFGRSANDPNLDGGLMAEDPIRLLECESTYFVEKHY